MYNKMGQEKRLLKERDQTEGPLQSWIQRKINNKKTDPEEETKNRISENLQQKIRNIKGVSSTKKYYAYTDFSPFP